MGTNRQVFGSNAERSNFYKLSRQWGSTYRIYHNLPFLNVFNTKGLVNAKKLGSWSTLFDPNQPDKLAIGDIDYNRLKKTSIDYTLCDQNDHPLLCIEFDGIKDGFNVGTEYQFDGPPDPWREGSVRKKGYLWQVDFVDFHGQLKANDFLMEGENSWKFAWTTRRGPL